MRPVLTIGIGCGLPGLLAGLAAQQSSAEKNFATIQLAILTIVGVIAIALARSRLKTSEPVDVLRHSTTAGVLGVIVAASMMVLGVRIMHTDLAAKIALLSAAACVLPAIAFSTLLVAFLPVLGEAHAGSRDETKSSAGDAATTNLKIAAGILIAVGIGSAFLNSRPPPPVAPPVPQTVQPVKVPPPPVDPKTLLPFQEKDLTPEPELSKAPFGQWKLKSLDSLGQRFADGAWDLAPDRRFIAYLRRDATDLIVVELEHLRILSQVTLRHPAVTLRFSPDAQQVLAISSNPDAPMTLVSVSSGRTTELPRTRRRALPQAPFIWWKPNEFLLQNRPHPEMFLLDKLESVPAESLPDWSALTDAEKQRWLTARRPLDEQPKGYRLLRSQVPTSTSHPLHEGSADWIAATSPAWMLGDPGKAFQKLLAGVPCADDDRLIPILGEKALLHLRSDSVGVLSFTTEAPSHTLLDVTMPNEPSHVDCSPDVPAGLAEHSLLAMVYGPLVNTINQKVIGPDRSRLKALVRFHSWESTHAVLWVESSFAPVRAGDIIADAARWTGKGPAVLSRIIPGSPWWAPVTVPETADPAPPQRLTLTDIRPEARAIHDLTESAKSGDALVHFPEDLRFIVPDPTLMKSAREFVIEHHRRAAERETEKFISDFGAVVTPYYFKERMTRAEIEADELQQWGETESSTESIEGSIQVGPTPTGDLEVGYVLYVSYRLRDGRNRRTHRLMNLTLHWLGERFEITGCSAIEPKI